MRLVNPNIKYYPFSIWHYSLLPMFVVSLVGLYFIDSYYWLLLSVGMWWVFTIVCQSIGLHRYFTHRSFKLSLWKEKILACLTIFAHTGAPANFAVSHAYHHKHADQPDDLHDPSQIGILNSLIARYPYTEFDFNSRPDLQTPFYKTLDKYSTKIVIAVQLALLFINWKIAIFGLIIPQLLSVFSLLAGIVVMGHGKFASYRNFESNDKSRNSPLVFLFFFGEAWHNNHHANPGRACFKEKWWEFDPASFIVDIIRDDNPTPKLFPLRLWHKWFVAMLIICTIGLIATTSYYWLMLTFVMWLFLSTVGTHVGLHRYFTHKSFNLSRTKENILALISVLSYTGDPLGYSCTHHAHHKNSDTHVDAQSWRNIGIENCLLGRFQQTEFNFDDYYAISSEYHRWLNKYWVELVIAVQLVLLLINWQVAVFGLILPQVLCVVSLLLGTVVLTHYEKLGYKNFDNNDMSTNSPLVFLLATGEAWHNNHHKYPRSPTTKIKKWEIDPVYWVICLIRDKEAN